MRYAALPKAEQKLVLELQGWKMRNYIASKNAVQISHLLKGR